MIRVEGNKNLFRDEKSGAIIDMDNRAYASYMSSKNRKLDEKAELDEMKKDLSLIHI